MESHFCAMQTLCEDKICYSTALFKWPSLAYHCTTILQCVDELLLLSLTREGTYFHIFHEEVCTIQAIINLPSSTLLSVAKIGEESFTQKFTKYAWGLQTRCTKVIQTS